MLLRGARAHPFAFTAIVLGLALRLVLMPTAVYGDLHAIAYGLHLLGFHGVGNVYAAIQALPPEQMPVPSLARDFFPYPPLTYYVLGGAMALLSPLYGDGFSAAVSSRLPEFIAPHPQIYLWLTLYKLPLLAGDLGIAAVLASLGATAAERWRLAALWMLNPLPVIAGYLFGQFDVWPALFVLLAWAAAMRGHPWWGVVALGVGAGFKTFPLLLLLPYAVIMGRSWLQRGGLALAGLLTFGAAFLPVAGDPVTFQVVFGGGPSHRVFSGGIEIGEMFGNAGRIYLVFLFYAFLLLHAARSAAGRPAHLGRYLLAVLLLTYAFAYSHLQWLTWSAPLLTLDWERRPANRLTQLAIYGAAIVVGWSWQVGPPLEFFRPVSPDAITAIPELRELLDPQSELPGQIANLMRSVLAGAALFWTYANVLQPAAEARPRALSAPAPEPALGTFARDNAARSEMEESGRRREAG